MLTTKAVDWGSIPFKFINGWLSMEGCLEVIKEVFGKDVGKADLLMKLRLRILKRSLRRWSKEHYENFDAKVQLFVARLAREDAFRNSLFSFGDNLRR
ncbi:hypothetical protein V6N13_122104 [Hibiscus sabdariffa]